MFWLFPLSVHLELKSALTMSMTDRRHSKSSFRDVSKVYGPLLVFHPLAGFSRFPMIPSGPSSVGQKCQVWFHAVRYDQFVCWVPVTKQTRLTLTQYKSLGFRSHHAMKNRKSKHIVYIFSTISLTSLLTVIADQLTITKHMPELRFVHGHCFIQPLFKLIRSLWI